MVSRAFKIFIASLLIWLQAQQQRSVGIFKGSQNGLFGRTGQPRRYNLWRNLPRGICAFVLAYTGGDEPVQRGVHRRCPWYELLDEAGEREEKPGAGSDFERWRGRHGHVARRRKVSRLAILRVIRENEPRCSGRRPPTRVGSSWCKA